MFYYVNQIVCSLFDNFMALLSFGSVRFVIGDFGVRTTNVLLHAIGMWCCFDSFLYSSHVRRSFLACLLQREGYTNSPTTLFVLETILGYLKLICSVSYSIVVHQLLVGDTPVLIFVICSSYFILT